MTARRRAAELAGAWALAGAAPLLDVFGRGVTYFVALRASPAEVLAFTLAIALLPPALLLAAEGIVGRVRGEATAERLHAALLALLAALLALPLLRRAGLDLGALPLALALGAAFALLARRLAALRALVAYAAPAALVVPAVFLLGGEVRRLVLPPAVVGLARPSVERPAPVVVVVFDELPLASLLEPGGGVDAERFPSFAALATTATWYDGAVAAASATDLAVPALLTGRRPVPGAPPVLPSHPASLFTLLPRSYGVRAHETVTRLCPPSRCALPPASAGSPLPLMLADASAALLHLAAPPWLAKGLPPLSGRWGGFWGEAPAAPAAPAPLDAVRFPEASFRAFLDGLAPSRHPRLDFVHVNVPHMPLRFLPTGRAYARSREALPAAWGDEPAAVATAHRRHLLAAGFADRLLGELVSRLRALGLWDDVLLVVTSDHGVAFAPGRPTRTPDAETLGDIAPVPLFVKAPHQAQGRRETGAFALIDLLPIVARELGLELPEGIDGVVSPPPAREHVLVSEGGEPFRFGAAQARDALARAVRRKAEAFGTGAWERVFAPAVRGELFGREVADLGSPPRPGGEATLDQAGALGAVDPAGDFVPALLTGRVPRGLPGALAVALGGRVAAVLPRGALREGRFEALVPWTWLRPGANEVRLLVVGEAPGAPVLEELRLARAPSLAGGVLRAADGAAVPLRAGDPAGEVEDVRRRGGAGLVQGWALGSGGAPDVLVFVRDRLAARTVAGAFRPDLAAARGEAFARAGFAVDVELLAGEEDAPLRVYALSPAGHAALLPVAAARAAR